MKLERKIKPAPIVPMASMSDIAFLLIIFFMVSTTFIREAGIRVTPPRTREAEELRKKSAGTITIDEEGKAYLDGTLFSVTRLPEELERRFQQRNLKERTVVLKCDKEVRSSVYLPVIEQISQVGATLEIWVEPQVKKK